MMIWVHDLTRGQGKRDEILEESAVQVEPIRGNKIQGTAFNCGKAA
jgi:hypothetical protein